MKLSPHEIADLVIKAGFSKTTIIAGTTDSEAVVAVAIALAESGGDTEAISRTTAALTSDPNSIGNRDHGLFQLSGRWQYPKIQAVKGNWRDPIVNTSIAYEIFKGAGRGFKPWSTFTKNAKGIAPFEQFLPDARLAVSQPWSYTTPEANLLSSLTATCLSTAATVVALNQTVELLQVQVAQIRKHFS